VSSAAPAVYSGAVRRASVALFARYAAVLDSARGTDLPAPDGTGAAHLRWMCATALESSHDWSEDKLSRWLGFVQGVMCARGQLTVDDEREFSRPLFHAAHHAAGLPAPAPVAPSVVA
jgi:hypothetical protein